MILTILRIQYLRLRNNPLELLLVFVMPIVFFSIFAAIFSNGIATGSDKKLRIGWIAGRPTALGTELKKFIEQTPSLQCLAIDSASQPAGWPNDRRSEGADEAIYDLAVEKLVADAQRSGRYDLIIRLPADFPAELTLKKAEAPCLVQLVTDGQNPMAVDVVSSVVRGFFAQKKAALVAGQLAAFENSKLLSGPLTSQSYNQLSNRPGSAGANPALVNPAVDGSQSQPIVQRENLQHFDDLKDPASSVDRGVRFYDPQRDRSRVFDGSTLNDSSVAGLGSSSVSGSTVGGSSGNSMTAAPSGALLSESPKVQNSSPLIDKLLLGKSSSSSESPVEISIENPQSATQENPRIAMYAAGIAVLFLLFSSTGNAAALLEEAESGTLDRILIGKAGLFEIVGGKWLGIFVLGCVQISVMFLWAELVFKIQLWKHLAGFAVMTVCTAAATSSFAMVMATLCNSRAQLNAVSIVLILSMSAVGGSMIPRFVMSDRMKEIGKFTFNAWALDGYQKIFWFQSPISSLEKEVTVLLGSSLLLGVLSLVLSFRWKRG